MFGKQTDSTGVYTKIWVAVKLPPARSLSSCFTEDIRLSLQNTFQKYVDEIHRGFTAIKWNETEDSAMEYMEKKIYHIVNCCVEATLRDPNQTCSWCFTQFDDAMSILENDGYFDFGRMLEYMSGEELKISIDTHQYSNINSKYNIVFKTKDGSKEYNFTDALEYYKVNYVSSSVGLSIDVKLYDDIPNDILCFKEDNTSAMVRKNNAPTEKIVLLNYQKGKKCFVKIDANSIELPKYIVNLYWNQENWSFGQMHKIGDTQNEISGIMEKAYEDASIIWQKNSFDIFKYNEVHDDQELEGLAFTESSIFFNVIKYAFGLNMHFGGEVTFSPIPFQKKEIKCFYNDCNIGRKYGNFINIGIIGDVKKKEFKSKQFILGYTLAHEIAHLLTLRGLYLMQIGGETFPLGYDWENTKNIDEESGGHFNPPEFGTNLLVSRDHRGGIPKPSSKINDLESLNKESIYLIVKFIISTL